MSLCCSNGCLFGATSVFITFYFHHLLLSAPKQAPFHFSDKKSALPDESLIQMKYKKKFLQEVTSESDGMPKQSKSVWPVYIFSSLSFPKTFWGLPQIQQPLAISFSQPWNIQDFLFKNICFPILRKAALATVTEETSQMLFWTVVFPKVFLVTPSTFNICPQLWRTQGRLSLEKS